MALRVQPAARSRRHTRRALLGMVTAVIAAGALVSAPDLATAATAPDITRAQRDLNGLAYGSLAEDGIEGTQTKKATSAFQSDRCLSIDGIIGPKTLGALDAVVKEVQAKAGTSATGLYDAATKAAVKNYQSAHGLSADGLAGPLTMKSMGVERLVESCHDTDAIREKAVAIAMGEVGTTADAGRCVPGKPYSICDEWCAAFATWVWRQAGVGIPSLNSVPQVYDWAVAQGRWVPTDQLSTARPGDLIIFGSAGNRYHIGVVDQVGGQNVRVVSGNTTNPDKPGQYGVYDKTYPLSASVFYGLVRP
ncbi:peptidoglycan-binding protein [Streptomyces sp. NPDC007983]|uniref:peptidoglycan-binding protein n=1 Tax=Streptomyces sp. NPDC007983 TaxID=3364800 RepID=UPI0036EA5BC3